MPRKVVPGRTPITYPLDYHAAPNSERSNLSNSPRACRSNLCDLFEYDLFILAGDRLSCAETTLGSLTCIDVTDLLDLGALEGAVGLRLLPIRRITVPRMKSRIRRRIQILDLCSTPGSENIRRSNAHKSTPWTDSFRTYVKRVQPAGSGKYSALLQ